MKKRNVEDLIGVALGSKPADIFIENGKILNVYSGEVLEGWNVAVKGDRIAYTGPSRKMVGEETRVIDARGLYLVPGYIDAHGHADLLSNPLALARAVLPLGTTAVLTDTHEMAGALGIGGIDLMLDITEGLPVKFYLALTAANPPHPAIEGEDSITGDDFRRYMEHSRVLAISEITPWKRLIDMDPVLTGKVCYAYGLGKRVEGHGAGCSHERMNALVNAGITSCHESVSVEDVQSRLFWAVMNPTWPWLLTAWWKWVEDMFWSGMERLWRNVPWRWGGSCLTGIYRNWPKTFSWSKRSSWKWAAPLKTRWSPLASFPFQDCLLPA